MARATAPPRSRVWPCAGGRRSGDRYSRPGAGKGGAVLEGFRRARGRYVAFTDADAATAAESLVELVRGLRTHDVVIGSRRSPRRSIITRAQPPARRLLGHLFAGVARVLLRLPYRDTQCGAKAFRAEAAQILAELVREQFWTLPPRSPAHRPRPGAGRRRSALSAGPINQARGQLWPAAGCPPFTLRLARRSPRRSAAATGRAFASVASGESTHDRTLAHSRV